MIGRLAVYNEDRVGLALIVVSKSAPHAVGRGLAPRPVHTKDHKNGTNCVCIFVGV